MDKSKLTHIERKNLYTKIYGRRTLEYWNKKDSVPMDLEQIDWELSRQPSRKEPKGRRRVDIKLLCKQCRLNKVLFHRQKQDNHRCPLCDGDREDRDHLLTCPHTEATKLNLKRITELGKKLEKLKTNAKLSKLIIGSLRRIRKRFPVRDVLIF